MRTLTRALLACVLLAPRVALAQGDPKPGDQPPVVPMDNVAAPQGQPATPAPETPPPAPPPQASQGPSSVGGAATSSDWKFDFHGYFRAPMRLGLGHNDKPAAGQSSSTIHYPLVPDDQYLSWQYTSVQSKDWSEVFLSYGNSWVKGTIGLQGYNFTDAAWQQASAQFGIAQAYVTLTPRLGYQNVRLEAKVGSFWNKYGTSGKYDAGKYDVYLFGRTHAMGESVRMAIDIDKVTLWAEEGFGAKQPDPNMYNPSKFSLLFHGHGGLSYNRMVDFNFHVLHAWAHEEDRPANASGGASQPFTGLPDGSLTIFGPELRVSNTPAGELYLGFSRVQANHATVVTDVVEVIHSGGGQTYSQGIQGNYLDGPTKSSNGNGAINSLLLEYNFSLANLLANIKHASFWGDGPDLAASFFMMFNSVSSDDKDMDGVKKIKYGVDLLGTPLKWLGIGFRYDRVQPNSKIPEQSFGIISPRIMFRTAFLTHEEITFQYSRYLYNERICPTGDTLRCVQPPPSPVLPNGFGAPVSSLDPNQRGAPNTRPDLNVLKLQASMWW